MSGGTKGHSPLDLVLELCEALEAEGILYCHWKSNAALDRSATGENDLDLLVSRVDVQRFTEILWRLGFKEVRVPLRRQMPGLLSYYGCDSDTGKFVHVHVHYQLILGHDVTKNYHLPIETPFLESGVQGDLFRVPAPEFEFIVFVIRMILKHSTWDTILFPEGTLSTAERQELAYLLSQVNQTQMYDILKQHLPYVGATLFDACMQSLRPGCSVWTRLRTGYQLQARLKAHARRSRASNVGLKLWCRVIWALRRIVSSRPSRKRLASGGMIVAIVGGDGAGKTTAADELFAWVSKDFETIKVHMGKPSWSSITIMVRGILKIGRSLGLYPYSRALLWHTLDGNPSVFPGYPWLLRAVCTARDRHQTYLKARRFATNGGLVICDRFPLPQVKSMDGPQARRMAGAHQNNPLIRFLIELEERYYQAIMPPELLIVLKVAPQTAVQRKADEDGASVRGRSAEIWELNWQETSAHLIDAGQSKAEVLSQVKALVWSQL